MRRGFTLIEMMIVVALLGIGVGVFGNAARIQRSEGLAEVQRARAEQILEYQANRLSSGRPVSVATMKQLTAGLPGTRITTEQEKETTRLVVSWGVFPGARHSRSLVVFSKKGRR